MYLDGIEFNHIKNDSFTGYFTVSEHVKFIYDARELLQTIMLPS